MTPELAADLERVRAALPPLGVRARIEAVAFNAGLDVEMFTRLLFGVASAGEAKLKNGWVERAVPPARGEVEERGPGRFAPSSTWTPTPEPGARER